MTESYEMLCEGKAKIETPANKGVFYNPVQEFNRDLSICVISHHQTLSKKEDKKFNIFEGLSATGLRSIRYAKEIKGVDSITANDLDPYAVETIKHNIKLNDVSDIVKANHGNASIYMYTNPSEFSVIDLDPYGSASPFLDAAVQSIKNNGLLCITCTDLAVLAGNTFPETALSKYGGSSIKSKFCHEMALRLVLNAVSFSASRYKRSIIPLLSLSIDFYVRVFVKVIDSPQKSKEIAKNHSIIYNCPTCYSFELQPLAQESTGKKENSKKFTNAKAISTISNGLCRFCSSRLTIGGPIWSGSIHNNAFVSSLLEATTTKTTDDFKTIERIRGMLFIAQKEVDAPLYHSLPSLCKVFRCEVLSMMLFRSAIVNLGYKISKTHCDPDAFKTDAPTDVIWDIIKAWIKLKPNNPDKLDEKIRNFFLAPLSTNEIDFKFNPEAKDVLPSFKLVRYQANPTKNWGPLARAKKMYG